MNEGRGAVRQEKQKNTEDDQRNKEQHQQVPSQIAISRQNSALFPKIKTECTPFLQEPRSPLTPAPMGNRHGSGDLGEGI